MDDAKEKARALKDAPACAVRHWGKIGRRIPKQPGGIYMFRDPRDRRCMYVGSATGKAGIRGRLRHQVYPSRIGKPWTLSEVEKLGEWKKVISGRNLLFNLLKACHGERFRRDIDLGSERGRDALNGAFERIHELTVQWVEIPDETMAVRAEHCAICLYQPKYVGVPGKTEQHRR